METLVIGIGATLGTLRGPAVCVAWSVEALAGLWRPQPQKLDRAGRALGVASIILFLLRSWLLRYVWL